MLHPWNSFPCQLKWGFKFKFEMELTQENQGLAFRVASPLLGQKVILLLPAMRVERIPLSHRLKTLNQNLSIQPLSFEQENKTATERAKARIRKVQQICNQCVAISKPLINKQSGKNPVAVQGNCAVKSVQLFTFQGLLIWGSSTRGNLTLIDSPVIPKYGEKQGLYVCVCNTRPSSISGFIGHQSSQ